MGAAHRPQRRLPVRRPGARRRARAPPRGEPVGRRVEVVGVAHLAGEAARARAPARRRGARSGPAWGARGTMPTSGMPPKYSNFSMVLASYGLILPSSSPPVSSVRWRRSPRRASSERGRSAREIMDFPEYRLDWQGRADHRRRPRNRQGIAEVLAQAGADVIINSLTATHVTPLAAELARSTGRKVVPLVADVDARPDVERAVAQVPPRLRQARHPRQQSRRLDPGPAGEPVGRGSSAS